MVDISEAEADMDIDKAAIIAALKDRQTVDPESMDPKILHRNGGTPVELPIASATLSGIRREGRDRGRGQRNGCEILLLLFLNMTINHIRVSTPRV